MTMVFTKTVKQFRNMTYRVGKKQNRAVMDSEGNALVIFPKGKENLAPVS